MLGRCCCPNVEASTGNANMQSSISSSLFVMSLPFIQAYAIILVQQVANSITFPEVLIRIPPIVQLETAPGTICCSL